MLCAGALGACAKDAKPDVLRVSAGAEPSIAGPERKIGGAEELCSRLARLEGPSRICERPGQKPCRPGELQVLLHTLIGAALGKQEPSCRTPSIQD